MHTEPNQESQQDSELGTEQELASRHEDSHHQDEDVNNDYDSDAYLNSLNGMVPPQFPSRTNAGEEDLLSSRLPMSPSAVSSTSDMPPLPQREEPTLKERLVERERQARVETERARLKRQFALSSNGGAATSDAHGEQQESLQEDQGARVDCDLQDASVNEGHGSVIGTMGEGSSVAAPPTDGAEDEHNNGDDAGADARLGYAMERFLSEYTSPGERPDQPDKGEEQVEPGVVMERFLAQAVDVIGDPPGVAAEALPPAQAASVVEDSIFPEGRGNNDDENGMVDQGNETHRTMDVTESMDLNADADTETQNGSDVQATLGSIRSFSTVSNDGNSIPDRNLDDLRSRDILPSTVESDVIGADRAPSELGTGEPASLRPTPSSLPQSPSSSSTRVLGLTAAEIQELADMEDASIGNAPPSDRDENFSDSSLVGDMIRDFDGSVAGGIGTFSVGTRTTALESASSIGGERVGQASDHVSEEHSTDEIQTDSVSSNLPLSPTMSHEAASVTTMPPSDIAQDEGPPSFIHNHELGVVRSPIDSHDDNAFTRVASSLGVAPSFEDSRGNLDAVACAAANKGIENRTVRPGMSPSPDAIEAALPQPVEFSASKRAASLPARLLNVNIEDFDFDKNWAYTPNSTGQDSFNDLPSSPMWPPEHVDTFLARPSPNEVPDLQNADRAQLRDRLQIPRFESNHTRERVGQNRLSDYGAIDSVAFRGSTRDERGLSERHMSIEFGGSETEEHEKESQPLLRISREVMVGDQNGIHQSLVDAFDEVHTESTETVRSDVDDCEKYLTSSVLERAFPERMSALIVTLIIEIPVVLMVSGGSDRLCQLLGRRKYMLLMGFLPLSSAISGNVGLQASTLTTRAISHFHVTVDTYVVWLKKEVYAAAFLGTGMGFIIGFCAYVASNFDFPFGFTIFMAQFVSILTAGLTGTLAPLVFTFIFRRDSGKWGGPLETAVQDIVGSFAMIMMSYRLLLLFPQGEIAPDDVCGVGDISDDMV